MKNLYDLLGVPSDVDADKLKKAYREAAKASHPDHHADDLNAAGRFRQIVQAYELLRDADRRAAYDRLLSQPRPFSAKLKRAISRAKHHILYDGVPAVVLAIILVTGYTLFVRISETPTNEAVKTIGDSDAFRSAQRDNAKGDNPDAITPPPAASVPRNDTLANDPRALEVTKNEPASGQPGEHTTDAAGNAGHSDIATDQPNADDPGKNQGLHVFDRHRLSERPPAVRRRADSPPFKQASLENGRSSACSGSQSCPGTVPPLFGVGF